MWPCPCTTSHRALRATDTRRPTMEPSYSEREERRGEQAREEYTTHTRVRVRVCVQYTYACAMKLR